MKYAIVIGLMLFALCACDKEGDVRIVEMSSSEIAIQVMDWKNDWAWVGKDGTSNSEMSHVLRWCSGLLVFDNENAACDYKEKFENQTRIKRIIECK